MTGTNFENEDGNGRASLADVHREYLGLRQYLLGGDEDFSKGDLNEGLARLEQIGRSGRDVVNLRAMVHASELQEVIGRVEKRIEKAYDALSKIHYRVGSEGERDETFNPEPVKERNHRRPRICLQYKLDARQALNAVKRAVVKGLGEVAESINYSVDKCGYAPELYACMAALSQIEDNSKERIDEINRKLAKL